MENMKEKENIFTKMVIIIFDNGKMAQRMEKEYYMIKTETFYMKEIL